MSTVVYTIIPLLLGSFLAVLAGWTRKVLVYPIGVISLGASLAFCVELLVAVLAQGTVSYHLGGWAPPWGIAFVVDTFSAGMLVLVSACALLAFLAYREELLDNTPQKLAATVSLILLTVAGHMGIVATGDLFNLYVLIEVAALSGYALLALSGGRASMASLAYLLIGSMGASLYLLGVGYLYIQTGSLNMADLAHLLPALPMNATLVATFVLLFVGLWAKMALFPFHGWLPGAYTHSAPASASLLAPLTTKVMLYVVVRLLVSVFPAGVMVPELLPGAAVLLATAAILTGSVMAFRQRNQRAMLCYILVAEVGYMVGGVFVGNRTAMTGAMLHVFADALMTLTLFLCIGSIVRQRGSMALADMRGLFASMPFTMAVFVLGAMSMIGVPPLFGFFSKWYLLSGALQAGQYGFMAALLLSSLVNVVLFFRFFEVAFFEKPAEPVEQGEDWSRLLPLGAAGLSLILAGLMSGQIVERFIAGVIPHSLI